MKLKAFVSKLEDVPKEFQGLYSPVEGGFALDIEDKEYKTKLDEFRSNNRNLFKEKEDLEKKLADLGLNGADAAKVKEALAALEQLSKMEEGKLLKDGKLDEVVKLRTETMRKDYENRIVALENKIKAAETKAQTASQELSGLVIERDVSKAIGAVGAVRQGAMTDVLLRARSTWQRDEAGKLVAKNPDGTQIFGKKGEPLTLQEWAETLKEEASYIFEPSQGAGAKGAPPKAGGSGKTGAVVVDLTDPVQVGQNLEEMAKGNFVSSGDQRR